MRSKRLCIALLALVMIATMAAPAMARDIPEGVRVGNTGKIEVGSSRGVPKILLDGKTGQIVVPAGGTLAFGSASFPTTVAAGKTMIYGYGYHDTNALTGDLIGVRGNARVNVDSAAGSAIGGYFQAGNMAAGYNMAAVRAVYAEIVNKISADAASTWANARGVEINLDLDQGSADHVFTFTDAAGIWMKWNLPTAGTYTTVTNGYGAIFDNEAVGGTGQALDAAIYVKDTSMSGGIHGWDYAIDLSGVASGGFTVADIRLASAITISSGTGSPDGSITAPQGSFYIDIAGAADNQLWINEAGSTGWCAVQTTP